MKLNDQYKGIAAVQVGDGSTIYFWQDLWNGNIPIHQYPELYSFAKNSDLSLRTVWLAPNILDLFYLPLSEQAFMQIQNLYEVLESLNLETGQDLWTCIWGSAGYSTSAAYKIMKGHRQVDPAFKWL